MNRRSYLTCQKLLRVQREAEIRGGGGWPGKSVNAPVETLYPNLVAEMGWGFSWLRLPAEFADVSKEIMAAVLEDNEELSRPELLRLARYLGSPVGYLTAPDMSFVDPATNKGKARRRALADLLKQADGLDFRQWAAEQALSSLTNGKAITYAAYRYVMKDIENAIYWNQRAQHKPRSTRRRATA